MDTLSPYIIAQIFALLAMLAFTWSQQCKNRTYLLIFIIAGNLFNAIHFYILGAISGTVLAIIGAVRFGVSIFSIHKAWLVTFLVINTLATYFIFEGYLLTSVSYIAATAIIISSFFASDNYMRIAIIIGALGWLVYGILIESIVAIISNFIFLISSVYGWYKYVYKLHLP